MKAPLRHTPLLPGTLENLFYPPENYKYFARAAELPFATASAVGKAAWAADAAVLSYGRYGRRVMTDTELEENFAQAKLSWTKIGGASGNWNAPGTQAAFAFCDDFAILAFRGTERDDPDDPLSDVDIALVHEPDYRATHHLGPVLGHLSFTAHMFSQTCFVHRGFQRALGQVWNEVHSAVTTYRNLHPDAEICFTGHSLGAALALLSFSRFADPGLSLYTFGCPRVGDGAFRDRVMLNCGKGVFRCVNYNDIVAHVPTESLFYKQAPTLCYRFDEDGNLGTDDESFRGDLEALRAAFDALPTSLRLGNLDDIPAPAGLVDHSPARYCFRLWDCI